MDNFQNQQIMQEEEIKLSDYFRIMMHYKWLIIAIFIVVVSVTTVYTFRLPKIYKTSARVLIEGKSNDEMFMFNPAITNTSVNNTIEILKSRPVMKIALDKLKNDSDYESYPIYKASDNDADPVKILKRGIGVEAKRETDILTIGYESTSPEEAAAIVNSVVEALIETNRQVSREELTNIVRFLDDQLNQKKRELQSSEEDLRLFKMNNGISMLSEETTKLIEQSSELEAQFQSAQTEFQIALNNRDYLQNELGRQDSLLVNVNTLLTSPLLDQLRNEIVASQAEITGLLNKESYNSDHPEIITRNRELRNAKQKLDNEVRRIVKVKVGSSDPLKYRGTLIEKIATAEIDYNVAVARVRSLKGALEDYRIKMKLLPDTELELARLERSFNINDKIYSILREKYEDAKISEQAKMGNIRWLETAEVPERHIKPKKSMNLLIGLVLGLGMGVGVAFVIHSLDTKLRTLDDVENIVHLPVFGTIPSIEVSNSEMNSLENDIKKAGSNDKKALEEVHSQMAGRIITHYAPKSPVAESYRTFRTNLLAKRKADEKCMKILISSSGPKEGKSTTISNLAVTISQMGAKIVLLDMDLRRPMLNNIFSLNKENGVSDFLTGKVNDVSQVVKKTAIENLDIITSGFVPPNPSELISSKRMDDLLAQLEEQYDYVLIDSPPIIAVTDSLILGRKVDQIVVVIRTNFTEREIIKRTKEIVRTAGLSISGVVVNGVDVQKYYNGYSYYNYYYYYYYGENDKKGKKKGLR